MLKKCILCQPSITGYSALKEDLPHVGSNPSLHSVVNIAVDSQHSITSLDNHGPFSPLTSGASGKSFLMLCILQTHQ